MRTFAFVFVAFLAGAFSFAEEQERVPGATKAVDGMVWNKWETENFVILSIDYDFGNSLRSSIEGFRSDLCRRIGLEDASLPVKCKLVCVPDRRTLKRFFSIDEPAFEVRLDNSGSVSEMAIWLDEGSNLDLPVASVCLHGKPEFLVAGIPGLLSGSEGVSSMVGSSDSSVGFLWDGGAAKSSESVAVCLFVRREFGRAALSRILDGVPVDVACGFQERASFEKTFARYLDNLKSDMESGKTPETYLSPLD
jgi:hypothetical protein